MSSRLEAAEFLSDQSQKMTESCHSTCRTYTDESSLWIRTSIWRLRIDMWLKLVDRLKLLEFGYRTLPRIRLSTCSTREHSGRRRIPCVLSKCRIELSDS